MAEQDIQAGSAQVHAPRANLPAEVSASDVEHDSLFEVLVDNEQDVTGLVAYSLAMLAFRDWRAAFANRNHREATAEELAAFRLGEGSARRISDYRKLAERALAERGGTGETFVGIPGMPRRRVGQKPVNLKEALGYLALLCLLVAVLAIVVNYAKGRFFGP
jgi:hypothetical protein